MIVRLLRDDEAPHQRPAAALRAHLPHRVATGLAVAGRRLELHDVGAEIAEHRRDLRRREQDGEVEDAQAFEGAGRHYFRISMSSS